MHERLIPHSRPWISEDDAQAVRAQLVSGLVAQGAMVETFERQVGRYLGGVHTIAQSSGSAALALAFKVLGIQQGHEVILPTYVCRSVLEATMAAGAIPVLCDVDESGVITPETVGPHVTAKTRAMVAVHVFGHPCNVALLKQMRVPVIDDACQAFGLSVNGEMAGTIGHLGILSFHATKCLTTGEGGMLVSRDAELAERARYMTDGSAVPVPRHDARLSDLQAALGVAQLARYSQFIERRDRLRAQFATVARNQGIEVGATGQSNMLFRFTVRTSKPFDVVAKDFRTRGVVVRRGVDALLHRLLGMGDAGFGTAVRLFERTVSVPMYPSLNDDEASAIADALYCANDGD